MANTTDNEWPLNFRVFIHAYNLRPQTLFPVVATKRAKSIQKQTKSIVVDKEGSKKPLASTLYFV